MGENRRPGWEAYAMNHAANQMRAQQAQAHDYAAARGQAYLGQEQQAACLLARIDGTSDVLTVTAGDLGEIRIDGKLLRMVKYTAKLETLAEAVAHEAGKLYEAKVENVPTQEEYARALFESDPEVRAFVRSVADDVITDGPHSEWKFGERRRASQIAWERNEGGWRTRAEIRAFELIDAIYMGRTLQRQSKGDEG
jgi:hypothetical protein